MVEVQTAGILAAAVTFHELNGQAANPSTVEPLSPSGLLSDPADFLQHLLRFQLLESQQRQAQLVLLEEGRTGAHLHPAIHLGLFFC